MSLLDYSLLMMAVLLGGGLAFLVKEYNPKKLEMVLSFSGSYILGITVLHLMPGIFGNDNSSIPIGIWVLLGFFLQLILEQLSSGVEHGHIHASDHPHRGMVISIMLGLSVHAFLEGMPLNGYDAFLQSAHEGLHGHRHLLYGVILHKAPAAFALTLLLLLSKVNKAKVLLCLVLFTLMSPLGALVSDIMDFDLPKFKIIMAIVVGSFMHIATTIIFEIDNTHHHRISLTKLIAILIGIGMALLTLDW